jgi:hypothetical protein
VRGTSHRKEEYLGPELVDDLLYEPEDSGILWIKFNQPEKITRWSEQRRKKAQ